MKASDGATSAADIAAPSAANRRAWTTPRARRLATSAAAFGGSNQGDLEGFS